MAFVRRGRSQCLQNRVCYTILNKLYNAEIFFGLCCLVGRCLLACLLACKMEDGRWTVVAVVMILVCKCLSCQFATKKSDANIYTDKRYTFVFKIMLGLPTVAHNFVPDFNWTTMTNDHHGNMIPSLHYTVMRLTTSDHSKTAY